MGCFRRTELDLCLDHDLAFLCMFLLRQTCWRVIHQSMMQTVLPNSRCDGMFPKVNKATAEAKPIQMIRSGAKIRVAKRIAHRSMADHSVSKNLFADAYVNPLSYFISTILGFTSYS